MSDCPDPAVCAALGRHIHGWLYAIWTGTAKGVTSEECEKYRAKWRRRAGLSAEVLAASLGRPAEQAPLPRRGGPGTELKALLASLGLSVECRPCSDWSRQMDQWGPDGCIQQRGQIVERLRDAEAKQGWAARLKAAALAVATGLAFRLDPTDHLGSLVDEAIRRARK